MKSYAIGFAILLVSASIAEAQARKWTDDTGKHSVEAELVEVKGDTVVLKKPAGSVISLPMARLSQADQEYLQSLGKPAQEPPDDGPGAVAALRRLGASMSPGTGRVETVFLSGDRITDAALRHLKGLPALRELRLVQTGVTDVGLASLRELKSLEVLQVYGTGLTDDGLAFLKNLPRLTTLRLNATKVTGAGLVHLETLANLESLDLGFSPVADVAFEHLKRLPRLRELTLYRAQITRAGLTSLGDLSNLEVLKFGGLKGRDTTLSDADLVHLKKLKRLTALDLGGNAISDAGLMELTQLSNLNELDLSANRITDAGLVHLTALTGLESLGLDYNGSGISDRGLEHLRRLTNLKRLSLRDDVRITDAGLEYLGELTLLAELHLGGTRVSDGGLACLAKLTALSDLELGGTRITDAGLVHLEGLTNLRVLNLTGTPITDRGLMHLEKLKRLERLYLSFTKVSPAGINMLKRALPDATISAEGEYRGKILPSVKADVEVKRGQTARVELTPPPAASMAQPTAPARKEVPGSGLPDLQVTEVYLQDQGFMRARIKNAGTGGASEFVVAFFVDGRQTDTYGPVPLAPGAEQEASASRLPTGSHVVKVVVDLDNKVQESDETDNSKEAPLSLPR